MTGAHASVWRWLLQKFVGVVGSAQQPGNHWFARTLVFALCQASRWMCYCF